LPVPRLRAERPTQAATPVATLDPAVEDAALVAAARADRQAFRLLYERYFPRVYAYCYLRLGSREAAEDAAADVFLKALGGLEGYRGGVFAGWLFRIAQHVVADLRKRQRRAPPSLAFDLAGELPDPGRRPDDAAVAASELDQLRAALRTLPDDQRAVLELQLADLSPQEIAATLGRSLNAVRLLRYRAYRQIRPLLAGVEAGRGVAGGGLAW
jgi:RNA polymerase sigma-70 factor (ECF subfamily)